MSNSNRLMRSRTDRRIAGVCGGLAEYFGVDPMIIRAVFVIMAFIPGPSVLPYIVLWIVMPEAPAFPGQVPPPSPMQQAANRIDSAFNQQQPTAPRQGGTAQEPWRYDPYTGQPVNPNDQQGS